MRKFLALPLAALLLSACENPDATAPIAGAKRVVQLNPIDTKWIELDDGSRYGMGENLYQRLATKLEQSGKFVVVLPALAGGISSMRVNSLSATAPTPAATDASDRLHFDFPAVPAADYQAQITELNFSHGSRGLRRFAGNAGDFTTPYNNGRLENQNEFPARSLDLVTGWFGTTFDAIGTDPNSTITGVDFGAEGEFSVVVAGVNYRRDSYLAGTKLRSSLYLLAEAQEHQRTIDASGTGFLFAAGATYKAITAEFGLVRRTALKNTFDAAVEAMAASIQDELFAIPFRTRIERNGSDGVILNAGRREGIKVGDVFLHRAAGVVSRLTVKEVFAIGCVVDSPTTDIRIGDVVELSEGSAATPTPPKAAATAARLTLAAATTAPAPAASTLPDNRDPALPAAPTVSSAKIVLEPPQISDPDGQLGAALSAKGLLAAVYAYRYLQYDQDVDQSLKPAKPVNLAAAVKAHWNLSSIGVAAAFNRGLTGAGVKVAVIDSGVDYNHPNLASALPRSYAGFDFMSHDARPYDDNSHGTAVAGIIAGQGKERSQAGLSPGATVLAYKVFNPYGETTSAALYGAFQRAISDGAKVIVCAWDTKKESETLKAAIALAEQRDVLVVAAAGDKGADLRELPSYPARYNDHANVLSVAALDQSGKLSTVSGRYSNYGVGAVDLAAPGASLEVLAPRDNYLTRSGTDLAAAHVAAAAALVLQRNPSLGGAAVKDLLLRTAARRADLAQQVTDGRVLDVDAATK